MTMREDFEKEVRRCGGPVGHVDAAGVYIDEKVQDRWAKWQRAYAAGQRANPWEQAIKDAMTVHWIEGDHWSDPQKAIAALLERAAQHALDPQISEAAQALIAQGQRAERDVIAKDAYRIANERIAPLNTQKKVDQYTAARLQGQCDGAMMVHEAIRNRKEQG